MASSRMDRLPGLWPHRRRLGERDLGPGCSVLTVSIDRWGTLVAGASGFAFLLAAIVSLVIRKWRVAGYLAATAYVLYYPIHLWFWQFELIQRTPLPHWYFWSAVQQIVLGGIYLIWFSFRRRFRPVMTALFLLYMLSLLLQLFSYMYWTYGTTRNFTIRMTHLDSFYFALGTLTHRGKRQRISDQRNSPRPSDLADGS
jgi:hypothetical protein